jgi:hypothetical protein
MKISEITGRIDIYDRKPLIALENLYNRYACSHDEECNRYYLEDINNLLKIIKTRNYSIANLFVKKIEYNIENNIKNPVYYRDFLY